MILTKRNQAKMKQFVNLAKLQRYNGLNQARALSTAAEAKPIADYLLNMPKTDITTLSNGVRVATEEGYGETATVGVWIDAGSRYETAENNGVAHFLEHMAFKGTSGRSQRDLEVGVEDMGAHLNAYTSREQTVYYAKCFKKDIGKCMEILSDILQNPTLDEGNIERERGVILREMEEVQKINEEFVFDNLHETAFDGSGLGRTILGPKSNILSIKKNQLQDYIQTHYRGPRVVVAGAGAVSHEELVTLSEKYFGGLAKDDSFLDTSEKPHFIGSELSVRDDPRELAYVAVAFEGKSWTAPECVPIMLMQQILGSWDRTSAAGINHGSLLCQTVAENQLAHAVMAFNTCYKDTGLFGVYTVAEPANLQDLMFVLMNNFVRLTAETSEAEVEAAKSQLKSLMLSQLDGSSQICEDIGRQVLTYGRRITPAELFMRIDSVSAKEVRDVATDMIYDQDLVISALGSVHEQPDYNWMRRRTYWNRL